MKFKEEEELYSFLGELLLFASANNCVCEPLTNFVA